MYQQPPPPPNWQPGQFAPVPPPRKENWFRRHPIWTALIALFVLAGIIGALTDNTNGTTSVDTSPTPAPATKAVPTSKSQPTAHAKAPAVTLPTITHGRPHLGGPISDFYGKYGSHPFGGVRQGTAASGAAEETVSWVADSANAYLLTVDYFTSTHKVWRIDYSGPTWSQSQYQDYLFAFAPDGATRNPSADASQTDIAYTSDIGNFFMHISSGDGNMNTV